MSKKNVGSVYLDRTEKRHLKRNTNRKTLFSLMFSGVIAVFIMVLSLQPIIANLAVNSATTSGNASTSSAGTIQNVNAGPMPILCSADFGYGMDNKRNWFNTASYYSYPKLGNRTLSISEALASGVGFTNYHGVGKTDTWFVRDKEPDKDLPKDLFGQGKNTQDIVNTSTKKAEGLRGLNNCLSGNVATTTGTLLLNIASFNSTITQFFAVQTFNGNLICSTGVNKSNGACIDLLGIIGGHSASDKGLIGALTSSIYYPLLTIAVFIAAVWVFKTGIMKRKVREALFGALWVALSVIFGLALLLQPQLITKAPMAVNNAVTACVIGTFNGSNCMSGNSTHVNYDGAKSTSQNVCKSDVPSASIDEKMTIATVSITCSIWKAFVLEPATQANFGTNFNSLDTNEDTPMKKLLVSKGIDPSIYCVNLGTTRNINDQKNSTLVLDSSSNKVCNVMAYQMYLKVNANTNGTSTPATPDMNWYRIIVPASQDEGMWNSWATNYGGWNKIGMAGISLITSVLGGFIILVTSVMALVYYFSSVILMAFAPLFFLFGVVPGSGKRLFLGWLEKVISNVLKYLASAIFLIVAISIYGGILGNTNNIALILLFVIIVTMALFMYRSELINLIGRANMGGQQLSSKLTDTLGNKVKGISSASRKVAVAGVGGLAGAMLTSDGSLFSKEGIADGVAGFKDGTKRQLKRQSGFVGNIARQYDRNTVDNQRRLREKESDKRSELGYANQERATAEQDYNNALAERDNFMEETNREFANAKEQSTLLETRNSLVSGLTNDLRNSSSASGADRVRAIQNDNSLTDNQKKIQIERINTAVRDAHSFANYEDLLNKIANTELDIKITQGLPETPETLARLESLQNGLVQDKLALSNINTTGRVFQRHKDNFDAKLAEKEEIHGLSNFDTDEYVNSQVSVAGFKDKLDDLNTNVSDAHIKYNDASERASRLEYEVDKYNNAVNEMRPGEGLTDRGRNSIIDDIESVDSNTYHKPTQNFDAEFDSTLSDINPNDRYVHEPVYGEDGVNPLVTRRTKRKGRGNSNTPDHDDKSNNDPGTNPQPNDNGVPSAIPAPTSDKHHRQEDNNRRKEQENKRRKDDEKYRKEQADRQRKAREEYERSSESNKPDPFNEDQFNKDFLDALEDDQSRGGSSRRPGGIPRNPNGGIPTDRPGGSGNTPFGFDD